MPRPLCLHVDFIYPPIPNRNFDWCVYEDGQEEAGNYGYGATRAAAIADFWEQREDED